MGSNVVYMYFLVYTYYIQTCIFKQSLFCSGSNGVSKRAIARTTAGQDDARMTLRTSATAATMAAGDARMTARSWLQAQGNQASGGEARPAAQRPTAQ